MQRYDNLSVKICDKLYAVANAAQNKQLITGLAKTKSSGWHKNTYRITFLVPFIKGKKEHDTYIVFTVEIFKESSGQIDAISFISVAHGEPSIFNSGERVYVKGIEFDNKLDHLSTYINEAIQKQFVLDDACSVWLSHKNEAASFVYDLKTKKAHELELDVSHHGLWKQRSFKKTFKTLHEYAQVLMKTMDLVPYKAQ